MHSTVVLRHENTTLTVYQGKPSKNVLVLSTVHKTVSPSSNKKKTQETIEYYNATKYGVDVLDQKARMYTTKVSSRRWPLQVFYNVLDLAAINSVIIYNEVTNEKMTRRDFLLKLITELKEFWRPEQLSNESEKSPTPPQNSNKRVCCQVKCDRRSRKKLKNTVKTAIGQFVGPVFLQEKKS